MKLTLREADSDYVQFGKLRIPKDMSGMGFDDFQTAARKGQRAYDAEKEAERKAAEEARLAKMGEADFQKFEKVISDVGTSYTEDEEALRDCIEALFDEFVPAQGQCENLGAEIIRAMNRVGYRNYNDGDYFFTGYGLETCGSDMAFIYDNCDEDVQRAIDHVEELNQMMLGENRMSSEYDKRLFEAFVEIISYLESNPKVFGMPTEDSRSYESDILDKWEEDSKGHSYDVDTYEASDYVDKGWITWDDVREQIDGWVEYDIRQGTVEQWGRSEFSIVDLDMEHVEQCEEDISRWMEQWLQEVADEHEGEEDEYDDEEYDDEEDYDEE